MAMLSSVTPWLPFIPNPMRTFSVGSSNSTRTALIPSCHEVWFGLMPPMFSPARVSVDTTRTPAASVWVQVRRPPCARARAISCPFR